MSALYIVLLVLAVVWFSIVTAISTVLAVLTVIDVVAQRRRRRRYVDELAIRRSQRVHPSGYLSGRAG